MRARVTSLPEQDRRALPRTGPFARVRLGVVAALASCGASVGDEGSPTFADVAPVIHQRCSSCHRPGDAAPFSLLTYDDVRKHGRQIAAVTESRYMPPWLPAPSSDAAVSALADDRSLSEGELALLQDWIANGMPEGARDETPPPPEWPEGWQLGEPDRVLTMPRAFTVPKEGRDIYRNFVIPAVPGDRRHVRAVEWRPDNRRVVHHAALFIDRSGVSRSKEARDPLPGFLGMNAAPATMPSGQFYGWTPGNAPRAGNEAHSWVLDAHTDIVLQLHLRPTGRAEEVRVQIGLFFAEAPPTRHPTSLVLRSRVIDIAPGDSYYIVEDDYVVPTNLSLLGVYPHAHYLATDMQLWFTLPDETERRQLFRIPSWDFNWQDDYFYEDPVVLPRGTRLSMRFVYDNSADNPLNPSSPPKRVVHGEQSVDEMAELMLLVLPESEEDLPLLSRDFARKGLRDSKAYFELLARSQPSNAGWHRQLAETTLRSGEYAQSIQHHRTWLELRPSDTLASVGLARAMLGASDPEGAIATMRSLLKRSRRNLDARTLLARALLEAGRSEEARTELKRVLAKAPTDTEANIIMGDVELRDRRPDLAQERYRAALRSSPDSVKAIIRLGSLLTGDEAIAQYRAAVRLYQERFFGPDHERESDEIRSFQLLASALEARGELDEALRFFERAARIGPKSRELEDGARRVREKLRERSN